MAALQCSLYTIRTAAAAGNSHGAREPAAAKPHATASPTLISKKALLFQRKQISAHNHRRAQTPFKGMRLDSAAPQRVELLFAHSKLSQAGRKMWCFMVCISKEK
jgi:hypothetical protein